MGNTGNLDHAQKIVYIDKEIKNDRVAKYLLAMVDLPGTFVRLTEPVLDFYFFPKFMNKNINDVLKGDYASHFRMLFKAAIKKPLCIRVHSHSCPKFCPIIVP